MKNHRHFLIYKPYRVVSQFITNDRHQKNKRFLGDMFQFPENTMAVGRLDETTEGLLLVTTDGKFSYHVNKSGEFEKEYYAQVDGIISDEAINRLRSGVEIGLEGGKYNTLPCKAYKIDDPELPKTTQRIRDDRHGPTSWVSIIITEGKFRQVRKMLAAVGYPVLRLARVRIGEFNIQSLENKSVKEITDEVGR